MAQWASLPEWLWKKLVHQYGLEWAASYAQASLERPTLWIRSKSHGSMALNSSEPQKRIFEYPEFQKGEWIVQDISNQFLVREISAHLRQAFSNQTIHALDLCASPGGKSVGLAWNGIQVLATDQNVRRWTRLRETLNRAAPQVQLIEWEKVAECEKQHLVWVDAPCSGTGILKRHSEIRWLRQEKELLALTQVQQSLIQKAWDQVKSGGFLAYSVCSVLQEEGMGAIEGVGLNHAVVAQWSLFPQTDPFGDGFLCFLLKKPE
jgi:16S rRNA (cytosine967-C5)-methyltransferase